MSSQLKKVVVYIKFILLLICSFYIEKTFYDSYHRDNLFEIFIYSGIGIFWIFCFSTIVKDEIDKFRINRKYFSFWKSGISILSLTSLFFIYFHYQPKLNKPTLFFAELHGVYADFKTDGTYFIKSGPWASKAYFYGKYILKDSIVELDRAPLGKELISKRLMIKNTINQMEMELPAEFRMSSPTYMVQLDRDSFLKYESADTGGKTYVIPFRFNLTIDNRKKFVRNSTP
jgi:TM2 domain-containing membrane protein YozV